MKDTIYYVGKPKNIDEMTKETIYKKAIAEIDGVLEGENNMVMKMATINCILKLHVPYAYWLGFYCVDGEEHLTVGPYQGTLGCLHIPFGKGVCGRVAKSKKTIFVENVHALKEGEEHITCDSKVKSEIVVPVFDNIGNLIAVFDMDSTLIKSFDNIDQQYLEQIMEKQFSATDLKKSYG